MMRLLAIACMLPTVLLVAATARAQDTLVNHLTMNQWVQLSSDNTLTVRVVLPSTGGEFSALKDVSVAIKQRNGEPFRGRTDAKGEARFGNVSPGVYALTARGENVFACSALHVIASDSSIDTFSRVAEVAAAKVDYTIVNTAMIRYLPPKPLMDVGSLRDAKLPDLASLVCGEDMFRVAQSEGGMEGRIHLAGASGSDLRGADMTNVFIFKDGYELKRTLTDSEGRFEFESVPPGHYSLLAIGAGGIGLISFELVDADALNETPVEENDADGKLVVRRHRCCCRRFALQVAPMPQCVTCIETVVVPETIVETPILPADGMVLDSVPAPVPGGGYYPTYGGGGGFHGGGGGGGFYGGGGGGLGGIAALGAIGGLIAVAVDDDDDNRFVVPVVASPAIPGN